MTFDRYGLDAWAEDIEFEVTRERIAEYVAATNDPIDDHRSGRVAPPVFAVVPTFMAFAPAALAVAPVDLLMKLVHGKQDFHFHRPIRPGDVLTARRSPPDLPRPGTVPPSRSTAKPGMRTANWSTSSG